MELSRRLVFLSFAAVVYSVVSSWIPVETFVLYEVMRPFVDELVCFSAGLSIGAEGLPAVGALGLDRLTAAPRFTLLRSSQVGPDVLQVWGRALS